MGTEPLANYLPVLIMFLVATGFAGSTLLISHLLSPRSAPNPSKDVAYECGMEPVGSTRERFSVKFYLVAMLFILFDIEIIFILIWSVLFRQLGWFGLVEMGLFLVILLVGLTYVWKKGALDWER